MATSSSTKIPEDLTKWLVSVNEQTRKLRDLALDGLSAFKEKNDSAIALVRKGLEEPWNTFETLWSPRFAGLPRQNYKNLGRHISFAQDVDYDDMLRRDLPGMEREAEAYFYSHYRKEGDSLEALLHPEIARHAYDHYKRGKLRDAVLNSIVAVIDMIRRKTNLRGTEVDVLTKALTGEAPRLRISSVKGQSGQDEQEGFHLIFLGAWKGIRNPKAHTLEHDLTREKAAQYLVFASLLARRVDESKRQRAKRKPATK